MEGRFNYKKIYSETDTNNLFLIQKDGEWINGVGKCLAFTKKLQKMKFALSKNKIFMDSRQLYMYTSFVDDLMREGGFVDITHEDSDYYYFIAFTKTEYQNNYFVNVMFRSFVHSTHYLFPYIAVEMLERGFDQEKILLFLFTLATDDYYYLANIKIRRDDIPFIMLENSTLYRHMIRYKLDFNFGLKPVKDDLYIDKVQKLIPFKIREADTNPNQYFLNMLEGEDDFKVMVERFIRPNVEVKEMTYKNNGKTYDLDYDERRDKLFFYSRGRKIEVKNKHLEKVNILLKWKE